MVSSASPLPWLRHQGTRLQAAFHPWSPSPHGTKRVILKLNVLIKRNAFYKGDETRWTRWGDNGVNRWTNCYCCNPSTPLLNLILLNLRVVARNTYFIWSNVMQHRVWGESCDRDLCRWVADLGWGPMGGGLTGGRFSSILVRCKARLATSSA